jgi:hypothetical protein
VILLHKSQLSIELKKPTKFLVGAQRAELWHGDFS